MAAASIGAGRSPSMVLLSKLVAENGSAALSTSGVAGGSGAPGRGGRGVREATTPPGRTGGGSEDPRAARHRTACPTAEPKTRRGRLAPLESLRKEAPSSQVSLSALASGDDAAPPMRGGGRGGRTACAASTRGSGRSRRTRLNRLPPGMTWKCCACGAAGGGVPLSGKLSGAVRGLSCGTAGAQSQPTQRHAPGSPVPWRSRSGGGTRCIPGGGRVFTTRTGGLDAWRDSLSSSVCLLFASWMMSHTNSTLRSAKPCRRRRRRARSMAQGIGAQRVRTPVPRTGWG